MNLDDFFAELARHGSAPSSLWPAGESLADFGLVADGGQVVPAGKFEPLVAEALRAALSRSAREWLESLEIHPVIDSTNAELMARARERPVAGNVCTAELQTRGRGRRGRSWASPFGANLAISLGMATSRDAAAMGGVSLAVGLAVVDALEAFAVDGLALKWPNDVLRHGAKLGGILIELCRRPDGAELVIGVGVNVALPAPVRAALPDAVADLSGVADRPERSRLAGAIVSSVVEFVAEFDQHGFEPFVPAFDARHAYHGKDCRVLLGDHEVVGRVCGVSGNGELLLETGRGRQAFHGGEVSLRQAS